MSRDLDLAVESVLAFDGHRYLERLARRQHERISGKLQRKVRCRFCNSQAIYISKSAVSISIPNNNSVVAVGGNRLHKFAVTLAIRVVDFTNHFAVCRDHLQKRIEQESERIGFDSEVDLLSFGRSKSEHVLVPRFRDAARYNGGQFEWLRVVSRRSGCGHHAAMR